MSILQTAPVTQVPMLGRISRTPVYQGIARLIWSQYCLENDIVRTPFEHAPQAFTRELLQVAEALANMVLEPDVRDAAIMCAADAIHEGTYERLDQVSKQTALRYLQTAEAGIEAFLLNLLEVPPDAHYRDEMMRLVDGLAPKEISNV